MYSTVRFLFIPLLAALFVTGCGSRNYRDETLYIGGFRPGQQERRAPHDDVSYWDGEGMGGASSIRIDLNDQRAYFYKGGQLAGISVVSTGREGFSTPTGNFKILQKNQGHISSIYGDYVDAQTGEVVVKDVDRRKDRMPPGCRYRGAPMPYFMRFAGGVGMHEGFLPGFPASHGCIRMPGFMAERFFENVQIGTPVTVTH
jgi:lipoprotein-anchoring transpeptidase ErfK/SrfK